MSMPAGSGRLEHVKGEIVRLHVEDGLNLSEIGRRYSCSREMVRLVLKERGAPSLTNHRHQVRRETKRVLLAVAVAGRHEAIRQTHGTRTLYNLGCHCDECRRANRDGARSLKGKTPPTHGNSGYVNYQCRCRVCKRANSAAQKRGRERAKERHAGVMAC